MRKNLTLRALCMLGITIAVTAQGGAPGEPVSAADLQHHRWILDSINGEALSLDEGPVPELDFGEQMHVSGNTGCNQMSGTAELRDGRLSVPGMAVTRRLCSPERNELERIVMDVLGQAAQVSIDDENNLFLVTDEIVLRFRLHDWVS